MKFAVDEVDEWLCLLAAIAAGLMMDLMRVVFGFGGLLGCSEVWMLDLNNKYQIKIIIFFYEIKRNVQTCIDSTRETVDMLIGV